MTNKYKVSYVKKLKVRHCSLFTKLTLQYFPLSENGLILPHL